MCAIAVVPAFKNLILSIVYVLYFNPVYHYIFLVTNTYIKYMHIAVRNGRAEKGNWPMVHLMGIYFFYNCGSIMSYKTDSPITAK